MSASIRIVVNTSGISAFSAEMKELRKRLRQLEAGSPYTFTIIFSDASSISQIPRASFQDISSILNAAHQDIYQAKPVGQAFKQRVDLASGPVASMRQKAIAQFLASQPKPKPITRSDAQRAYAIAQNLFSPSFLAQMK